MSLPTKPEVLVKDDRVWLFMGADYKPMPWDVSNDLVKKLQRANVELRRQQKLRNRRERKLRQMVERCETAA